MALYKIAVIAVLLNNGKTAKADDLVDDSKFSNPVEKLVKDGFIKKATADEIKAWKKKTDPEEIAKAKAAKEAELAAKAAEEAAQRAADAAKAAELEANKGKEENPE